MSASIPKETNEIGVAVSNRALLDVSIVIPVFNEYKELSARLECWLNLKKLCKEVIFVDGGSADDSVDYLKRGDFVVVQAPLGRALQMNAGAELATASTIVFLHVDTQLPELKNEQWHTLMESQWGFFLVRLNNTTWPYRLLALGINVRSRVKKVGTGDQAIFIQKKLFDFIGGFPTIALMEDISLSRRLRKYCKPCIIDVPVITSARRWEKGGVVKVMLLMWSLQILFAFGVHPTRLARWYGYKEVTPKSTNQKAGEKTSEK